MLNKTNKIILAITATAVMAVSSPRATAALASFSASGPGGRSATAEFDVVGGNLQVTITSTSSAPLGGAGGWDSSYVLTGLFFDLNGGSLTPVSATPSGLQGTVPTGTVFGDYWHYGSWNSAAGAPNSATRGIGAAGLGFFGPRGNFNNNIPGPNGSIDGFDYGLINFDRSGGNGQIPGTTFASSAVFTLSGVGLDGLRAADFSNISFQYGTSLTEPNLTAVPEPGTMVAGAGLMMILCGSAVRKFRKSRV